ncbi:hypothetical protein QAD02_015943 [Eretmocerus hayati]|uniref:Uncharacterized protein n=1 Tax=Eretmocerus hayati TaxID=131215 RepID=A0ACC2PBG5_9HYME|nr:hypothetical protein QAD02_015943 [Eretmocerus hayati]
MFRTCLQNRIVRGHFGSKLCYKCYICHLQLSDEFESVQEHITSEKHVGRISQIDESFKEDELEILSSISEWKRKKLVENSITCHHEPDIFFCHICRHEISELSQTLEHIKDDQHMQTLAQKQSEKLTSSSSKHEPQKSNKTFTPKAIPPLMSLQLTLDDHVSRITQDVYSCNICNCRISGSANTQTHINGNAHKSKMEAMKTVTNEDDHINNAIADLSVDQMQSRSIIADIRSCNLCKIFLKDPLMMQCHVMQHLHEEVEFPQSCDILMFHSKESGKLNITCSLCKFRCSNSTQMYYHLKSQKHLDHLKLFLHVKCDVSTECTSSLTMNEENLKYKPNENVIRAFFCNVCNVSISGVTNVNQHKNGKKHKDSVSEYLKINAGLSDSISHMDFSGVYFCFVCDSSFCSLQMLLQHYNSFDHKSKMGNFAKIDQDPAMSFTALNRAIFIHCNSCDDKFSTLKAAVEHITEKHHESIKVPAANQKKSITRSNHTANSPTSESKLKSSSSETLKNTDEAHTRMEASYNDLRKFQMEFALQSSQKKQSPPPKQSKKVETSVVDLKHKVPMKKISLFDDVFIDHCIKPGSVNIYNSDPEFIRFLNAGMNLTMPQISGRYCFPCQTVLQDNFLTLYEHLQSQMHIENFRNMEFEDKVNYESRNQFSNLRLAKLFMEKRSKNLVTCYVCNTEIKFDYDEIFSHYKTAEHIKKSLSYRKETKALLEKMSVILEEAWYYAESFTCKICQVEFSSELCFVEHLQSLEHTKSIPNEMQLFYNFCPVCLKYWYGNLGTYSLHCKEEGHEYLVGNTSFIDSDLQEIDNGAQLFCNIDEQIQSLIIESDLANLDKNNELEVLRAIEDTVRNSYPKARAYIFGSRISCLGTPDGDIQIFLDCDQNYSSSSPKKEVQFYLANVCKDFASETDIWSVSEILTQVPVITVQHVSTYCNCKVYFSNGLCVEKSKLIGFYNTAYPMCRHLILYLKKWLKFIQCSSGSDYTVTMAISWCVIFYLQVQGVLPSVTELLCNSRGSKMVDGWECGYPRVGPSVSPNLNVTNHLQGFFAYYSKFDYQTSVACPFLGRIIQKHEFAKTDQLPDEMEIYKFRASANSSEIFQFDSPMCIQDPIELSQNLTQNITKSELRRFRKHCSESAKILLQSLAGMENFSLEKNGQSAVSIVTRN